MGERHFKGIIDKEDLIKFNDKVALLVENGKIWKGNHPEMRSWILGLDRIPAVQDASDSNSGVPSPWAAAGLWAAQEEVCTGQTSKASSALRAAPHREPCPLSEQGRH